MTLFIALMITTAATEINASAESIYLHTGKNMLNYFLILFYFKEKCICKTILFSFLSLYCAGNYEV